MRILVLSDIHGNRLALEAVLDAAGDVDEIWSLGDVVGYGPEPGWCVDRVAALCVTVSLGGNHDKAAIGRLDISQFNPAAQLATAWTSAQLGLDQKAYLGSLPSKNEARGITLVHGSPRAPVWEYVGDPATADDNFDALTTNICFVGHTHAAAISERPCDGTRATHGRWHPDQSISLANRRLMLNPGSVGQPRDGDPRASHAILEPIEGHVTLHRTPYDIGSVQAQMRDVGLPAQLADRLAVGR